MNGSISKASYLTSPCPYGKTDLIAQFDFEVVSESLSGTHFNPAPIAFVYRTFDGKKYQCKFPEHGGTCPLYKQAIAGKSCT